MSKNLPSASWSRPVSHFPREAAIGDLFIEVALRFPEKVAVVTGNRSLTYCELHSHASVLARKLQDAGVSPGTIVAICAERSLEMIVGLVAIVLSGGAYAPLDPDYPADRLAFMLADTAAPVLLVQRRLESKLPKNTNQVIYLDPPSFPSITPSSAVDSSVSPTTFPSLKSSSFAAPHSVNPGPLTPGSQLLASGREPLAYVMYTSGSTGQPKGVLVPHRAVVRLVRGSGFMEFGPDQVFLQAAPISFDASTLEIWGALLNGGRLALLAPGKLSLVELGRAVREFGVTSLWLTAGLFQIMVEENVEDLKNVCQLLAGGDVLPMVQVRKAFERLPNTTLINGYGPTENTTFTCCHTIRRDDLDRSSIPIGRPINNTSVYLLNEHMNPVETGDVGELFTGGAGLAMGYLNRPELTAERFVENPFAPGERLYRTGDLCRWSEGGFIEFVGRADQQVKIRGYRIELGEIEAALSQHTALNRVCAVVREDRPGDKQLVAYFICEVDAPGASELSQFLKSLLPEYMVPSAFVRLDSFPIDPNGKIDRRGFPPPEDQPVATQPVDNLSASETERAISEIWCELLGRPSVGMTENFFDLGGNSLLLAQAHGRLQTRLARSIAIADLFACTTVRTLAASLTPKQSLGGSESAAQERAQRQRRAQASRASLKFRK